MITFKTYLESVEENGAGYLTFTIDAKKAEDADSISTFQPKKLRSTADKSKTLGHRVFYAYPYSSSEKITDLLKSIKGSGSIKLDSPRLDIFINKTAKYVCSVFPEKVDIICCPKSSSPLVKKFAHQVGICLGLEVLYDSFSKKQILLPIDRKEAVQFIKGNFIDLEKFDFEYKSDEANKIATIDKLAKNILSSMKSKDFVEFKKIHKPHAKFVKNVISAESYFQNKLQDKIVLVVDDSFSSGGTISNIFRNTIYDQGAKDVFGLVMFLQRSK